MTYEEEWEKLKEKSMKEVDEIYAKYSPYPKGLDCPAGLTHELKEENRRFQAELAKLRKKYGR